MISGKVNEVHYQHRSSDAFYHRYSYDAENRLTGAQTSRDRLYWEEDAAYQYYRHGPLARTRIGQLGVQGIDYAYTLQGWLKGINADGTGDATLDMGLDGWNNAAQNAQNRLNARDVVAFSLQYYQGDYKKIQNTQPGLNPLPNLWNAQGNNRQLYNGNIAAMITDNQKLGNPLAYSYRYDQLNRITAMDAFEQPFGTPSLLQDYKERIAYDPNGNILTYLRNGAQADRGIEMDNLEYKYATVSGKPSNRLQYVKENDTKNFYVEDLKDQPTDNYAYDAIGNLVEDKQAGISNIGWTVYGKISYITKTDNSRLDYTYDASGNRIEKKYSKGGVEHYSWYVRDAQGNVMAVYEKRAETAVRNTEAHLYGSSRLGIANQRTKAVYTYTGTSITIKKHTFTRGEKFFELTNHLGNVLAVIADKKIPVGAVAGTAVNYFMADVVSATDYYPFGMPMPGRNGITSQSTWVPGRGFVAGTSYPDYLQVNARPYAPTPGSYRAGKEVELLPGFETATGTDELLVETQEGSGVLSNEYAGGEGSYESYGYYRYGFNGKENDNEVKGTGNQQDYGERIYDTRLGRFLSTDPMFSTFPWNTTYAFAENDPINFIDLDGLQKGRPTRPGSNGGRPVSNIAQQQGLGVQRTIRETQRTREIQQREVHNTRMRTDPTYRTNFVRSSRLTQEAAKQGYLQNAFNSAQLVFAGGGVRQNNKLGEQWDNLVNTTMINNPSYIGVGRQISLKITGRINGQDYTANVRVDNVGVMSVNGRVSLNLVEAKFSINEITINNVKQTLTPQQKIASDILINGTNVQFFIRGNGSASVMTQESATVGTKFVNGMNITGMVNQIQVVTPRPTQVGPSQDP